jgi:hypothetical protein
MPLARVPLTGSFDVAMANVSLERKLTVTNPAPNAAKIIVNDLELNVQGLPSLFFWIRLDSPVANILWNPLFAVDNVTAGGVTVPNWFPFTNGFILVPGNVTTFVIRAAVGTVGISLDIPAGTSIDITTAISAGG